MTAPGDAAIAHSAVILAAAARGSCALSGFPLTAETLRTIGACRALGVEIKEFPGEGPRGAVLRVTGKDFDFTPPAGGVIDCGDSAATLSLLTGLLAGLPFRVALKASVSAARPALFRPLAEALNAAGARVSLEVSGGAALVVVEGRESLEPLSVDLPPGNAAIKAPLLLAAARARGVSRLREKGRFQDHTENLLRHFGGGVEREAGDAGEIRVAGRAPLYARHLRLPGSLLCAAPWMAVAAARPGSELILRDIGLNVTRCGIIRVLLRMGARMTEEVESADGGEPSGTLTVRGAEPLRATHIDSAEFPSVADVLPALALAAATARGKTMIFAPAGFGAPDFAETVSLLHAFGAPARELASGGLEITGSGGAPLRAARLDCSGYGPLPAMTAAVAGLLSRGMTVINNARAIQDLDPGFAARLRAVQNPLPEPAQCL